ncbi:MAG: PKD domain-containing protein [Bacteroidales bacterium]|nr:PKD domain-containing protein [Bacteroidales bacterium]
MVRLITANASGCQDTLEQNVSIVPKPGVDFYNDSLLCLGSATTFFTDTTATQVGAVQTYNWNFGDGSPTANTQNPQHSYGVAGTFTVVLTISDTSGCQNAISHPVTIHSAPQSYFGPAGLCRVPHTVHRPELCPTGRYPCCMELGLWTLRHR